MRVESVLQGQLATNVQEDTMSTVRSYEATAAAHREAAATATTEAQMIFHLEQAFINSGLAVSAAYMA